MPHESHVQTTELKSVLQEKEVLENELENTKAAVGTFKDQKEVLESQIKLLKDQVDQLSLSDPNFSLVTEIGKLSVKYLEFKKVQEEFEKAKQDIVDKDKLLSDSLAEKENLKKKLDSVKESLIDAKHIIWDHIVKEIKKLKDYLIMIEDERALTTSFLANVTTVQEGMGDKYLQVHNAINYLNSKSKTQLHFVGIQDREDIIAQARKYIIKDNMVKDVTTKANFFLGRDEDFKVMFKDIFNQGWPNFQDKQGVCIAENDYHLKLLEKRNDTSAIDKLDLNIKGQHIF